MKYKNVKSGRVIDHIIYNSLSSTDKLMYKSHTRIDEDKDAEAERLRLSNANKADKVSTRGRDDDNFFYPSKNP